MSTGDGKAESAPPDVIILGNQAGVVAEPANSAPAPDPRLKNYVQDVRCLMLQLASWHDEQDRFYQLAFDFSDRWADLNPKLANDLTDPCDWAIGDMYQMKMRMLQKETQRKQ